MKRRRWTPPAGGRVPVIPVSACGFVASAPRCPPPRWACSLQAPLLAPVPPDNHCHHESAPLAPYGDVSPSLPIGYPREVPFAVEDVVLPLEVTVAFPGPTSVRWRTLRIGLLSILARCALTRSSCAIASPLKDCISLPRVSQCMVISSTRRWLALAASLGFKGG